MRLPFPPTADLIDDEAASERMDVCLDQLIAHTAADPNPFRPFRAGHDVDEFRSALILSLAPMLSSDVMELNQLFVSRTLYSESLSHSPDKAVKEAAREEFDRHVVDLGAAAFTSAKARSESPDVPCFFFGINLALGFGIPDRLKRYPGVFDRSGFSVEERTWAVVFGRTAADFLARQYLAARSLRDPVQALLLQEIGPRRDEGVERMNGLVAAVSRDLKSSESTIGGSLQHCEHTFRLTVDDPQPKAVDALRTAYALGYAATTKVWQRES